jgi:hypothetical protein
MNASGESYVPIPKVSVASERVRWFGSCSRCSPTRRNRVWSAATEAECDQLGDIHRITIHGDEA